MSFRSFSRNRVLAMSLAAATATTTLFAIGGAAGSAAAATGGGCPSSKTAASLPTDINVAANFTNNGNTSAYTFSAASEPAISLGVPGLIKYCVYPPKPPGLPTSHTVTAQGVSGPLWVYSTGSNNFAFVRPGGDKTNIAFPATDTPMGTATWGATAPTAQTIILHINDPTKCQQLFPGSTTGTCFVKPVKALGPVCNAGDSNVAYNAMPTDVVDCLNPAIGFEATTASEFGNEVLLKSGTGTTLSELKVDFQSFACENGHWNGVPGDNTTPEPCSTTSGDTFQWPITANIYAASSGGIPGPLLATDTETQTIPYRPSADTTHHCTGAANTADAASKWWNPAAVGGGACQNSIGIVLTFSNFKGPGGGAVAPLPGDVVWTVAFNTSDFGHTPQRPADCNTGLDSRFPTLGDGGCPYDSLNVGDNGNPGGQNPTSHIDNAPYAGSDVPTGAAFVNYADGSFYCTGGAGGTLRLDDAPCWLGFRPLGEIITSP